MPLPQRFTAILAFVTACSSEAPSTNDESPAGAPSGAAPTPTTSSPVGEADASRPPEAADASPPADAGTGRPPPVPGCDETYAVPPTSLPGFSPVLSATGGMTLTHDAAHGHNDGKGPVGFCGADVKPGQRFLGLVSARFETDQPLTDQHLLTDYTAKDPTFSQFGMGFCGGNVHIYVEVRDEAGARIAAGFDVRVAGQTIHIADQGKPKNEFPMNFAMSGGGNRYMVRATYNHPTDGALPSEAVTNMRLPINHHVNYLLTFQVMKR